MCCGNRRVQFRQGISTFPPSEFARVASPAMPSARSAAVTFQYTGGTGLTVVGAVTGRQYRFDGPGSRVAVDPRDRASVASINLLRQVRTVAFRTSETLK